MGIFGKKKFAKLKSKGKCPDCRGKGYHSFVGIDFFYSEPSDCPGCEGSGHFSAWSKNNL